MRKGLPMILVSGAAALALCLGATGALATARITWTVKPGGAFTSLGEAQVKDAKTGTVAKCASVSLNGKLKSGGGLAGDHIGTVTSASFDECTIGAISVTVAVKGLPWDVHALSYTPATMTAKMSVHGIDLVATAPGCTATLDGTAAGADNGVIFFSYSNSTGDMTLGPQGNLHSWAVAGCLGLVNNGDLQKVSGSLTISPRQDITSP